ncbi:MAG: helix-turn-helix domain-containing protein [Myxococcota bacterium]
MAYWERAPDSRLARFVERVAFSSDPRGEPSPPVRVIPDGRIDLLVSVDDRGEGRADVFGVKTSALFASSARPVTNVALRFRPGGACALLGGRADELTDRVLEADELLGAGFSASLLDAPSARVRSERLEAALLARLPSAAANADSLACVAAARIERASGRVRIAELAAALGVGERRLERAFRAQVGVAPKTFARIARFLAAFRALERGGRPVEIALAQGYFDQPHLVRDFVAFACDSPRRIFPSRGRASAASLGA